MGKTGGTSGSNQYARKGDAKTGKTGGVMVLDTSGPDLVKQVGFDWDDARAADHGFTDDKFKDPASIKWPRKLVTMNQTPWDELTKTEQDDIGLGTTSQFPHERACDYRHRTDMLRLIKDAKVGQDGCVAGAEVIADALNPRSVGASSTAVMQLGPNKVNDPTAGHRVQGLRNGVAVILANDPDRAWTPGEVAIVLDKMGAGGNKTDREAQWRRSYQELETLSRGIDGSISTVVRTDQGGTINYKYNPEGQSPLQTNRALGAQLSNLFDEKPQDDYSTEEIAIHLMIKGTVGDQPDAHLFGSIDNKLSQFAHNGHVTYDPQTKRWRPGGGHVCKPAIVLDSAAIDESLQ